MAACTRPDRSPRSSPSPCSSKKSTASPDRRNSLPLSLLLPSAHPLRVSLPSCSSPLTLREALHRPCSKQLILGESLCPPARPRPDSPSPRSSLRPDPSGLYNQLAQTIAARLPPSSETGTPLFKDATIQSLVRLPFSHTRTMQSP